MSRMSWLNEQKGGQQKSMICKKDGDGKRSGVSQLERVQVQKGYRYRKVSESKAIQPQHSRFRRGQVVSSWNNVIVEQQKIIKIIIYLRQKQELKMIKVRGLITSIKSNLLTTRSIFPHKLQDAWDKEFNAQNPKLNYLEKLLQTNEIRPYFIEKDIKQLAKQDIYFYMNNKQLFDAPSKYKKERLIQNPNANCILKFNLAIELSELRNDDVQKLLLHSFNTSVAELSTSDTFFCLQLIKSFNDAKEEINYYEVQRKILKEEDPSLFIKGVHFLSEFQFKLEMITPEMIHEKVSMVESFTIQTILYVKCIAKFYEIQLSEFCENRLRQVFKEKRRNFTEEEELGVVELLKFYPESANLINIEIMTADCYIAYLEFFIPDEDSPLKNVIPKPIEHPLPKSMMQTTATKTVKVIQHRVVLGLDKLDDIVKNIKTQLTESLNPVIALIRYLKTIDQMTPEYESHIEKAIYHKFIKAGTKTFQKFSLVEIFKVIGYMSANECGTINFWKRALKFVTEIIKDTQNYKNLSGEDQISFVCSLFQIFINKPFPRELQDQIINLALLSLTINSWTLEKLHFLTDQLVENRIGDNELWFGIEQRVNMIEFKHLGRSKERKFARRIVHNFNAVSKGSYKFWSRVNQGMSKKDKLQVLSHWKVPNTLANTYIKV